MISKRCLFGIGLLLSIGSALCAEPSAHRAGISAHRGDNKVAPENTLPAIIEAVRKGAQQIEFDVYLSSDGHLVVIHNETVDRTTNGTGRVAEMTFAELRALDAGSWFGEAFAGVQIPTLREVLEAIPLHIECNVHLKNAPGVAAAAALEIQAMGRLEQCFLACTLDQIAEAHAVVPEIRVCNMTRQRGDRAAYVRSTIEVGADYIQLHRREGIEGIAHHVRVLHEAGVLVNFCCTDDPEVIRALAAAHVDFILTDDLDTALRALAAFYSEPTAVPTAPR